MSRYQNERYTISYNARRGEGETIVYLHGLGCNKEDFDQAFRSPIFDNYSILSFDFPGYGCSHCLSKAIPDINGLAFMTNEIMEHLNIKAAHIIGHSMGALVGLIYSERYPEKVKSFVNVEGVMGPLNVLLAQKVAQGTYDNFVTKWFPQIIKINESLPGISHQIYTQTLQSSSPEVVFNHLVLIAQNAVSGNLLQRFMSLNLPRIFLYGSETAKDLLYLKELSQRLPVKEIPKSGHFPHFDNPQTYFELIAEFFDYNRSCLKK